MTTIRSRIGRVLDPVGRRSDATRRPRNRTGGVLRRRRPTCALLGRCAAGRRRRPGRHIGVGGREHGRSRRSPPLAAARTGGTLRFVEGRYRRYRRLVSGYGGVWPAQLGCDRGAATAPPVRVLRPAHLGAISANDASGRVLCQLVWEIAPESIPRGWCCRAGRAALPRPCRAPGVCYAGAAAKRAFGSASWRPLRELIPSLLNTLRRCHSTVRALM